MRRGRVTTMLPVTCIRPAGRCHWNSCARFRVITERETVVASEIRVMLGGIGWRTLVNAHPIRRSMLLFLATVAMPAACGTATLETSAREGAPASDAGSTVDRTAVPTADAVANETASSVVTGVVLDRETLRGLPGRSILIGDARAKSDENGRFVISSTTMIYDLAIVDPDGSTISIYKSLSRRDLVLAHRRSASRDPMAHSAFLNGKLSGGAAYPLTGQDLVAVYFFSQTTDDQVILGGAGPHPHGPEYGPMFLQWNGA